MVLCIRNGTYKIGNKTSIRESQLRRNAFEKTDFKGLLEKDVSNLKYKYKVREVRFEIEKLLSIVSGQGYKKYSSKRDNWCNWLEIVIVKLFCYLRLQKQ